MPIPRRKGRDDDEEEEEEGGGRRGFNTVRVKSSEQINKRRLTLAESFPNKIKKIKYILPLCAASVSSEYLIWTKQWHGSV